LRHGIVMNDRAAWSGIRAYPWADEGVFVALLASASARPATEGARKAHPDNIGLIIRSTVCTPGGGAGMLWGRA
jgi:3-oxoacyl-[acyl-carrier-protein] synthase III